MRHKLKNPLPFSGVGSLNSNFFPPRLHSPSILLPRFRRSWTGGRKCTEMERQFHNPRRIPQSKSLSTRKLWRGCGESNSDSKVRSLVPSSVGRHPPLFLYNMPSSAFLTVLDNTVVRTLFHSIFLGFEFCPYTYHFISP